MKRRGFTLIELLAVITILAVILTITIPIFLKVIKNSKETSKKDSVNLYGKSIENALAAYYMKHPEENEVTLQQLKQEELLEYKGKSVECEDVQILRRNVYLNKCKVGNKKVDTSYGKYTPEPELVQGLTPVEYDGENWKVANPNTEWYNYDEQKWANAVVLGNGVTKQVGDKVTVDGTNPEALMMLVWIPRYEYKYTNLGDQYAGGTREQPGGIEIKFISKSTTKESGNEYKIHPAFDFDGAKNGFWVGKFELSHETLSSSNTGDNLGCSTTSCTNASGLRILPNVSSLRYNDVSNFFYAIRSIENTNTFGLNNMDTHMMKNSEWGAVAYLSQSKYGKYGNSDYDGTNKEVYQNKSNEYKTGLSNGTPSQDESYTQCTYNQKKGTDEHQDKNNCGPGASTTGNIYGVYDMSGGAYEYVMGALGPEYPTLGNSGFTPDNIFTSGKVNPKYYNVYLNPTNSVDMDLTHSCKNGEINGPCYGDAMSETYGWYKNFSINPYEISPWITRGFSGLSEEAGIFVMRPSFGFSSNNLSTRMVGFRK